MCDELKIRNLSTKGSTVETRDRCNKSNPPVETEVKHNNVIKGKIGVQLGLMEALWSRRRIDPNITKLPTVVEDRDIFRSTHVFVDELSEIEMTIGSLGIEIVFTPKA